MWPSQTALYQLAHYPQVVLKLRCSCFQLLAWVHLSHLALCWNWWVINSSYAGSSCTLPHPWGVPHKLVHQDRAHFLLHIPYSPISSVFCDGPWRQLHGLGLCPQLPRPLPCFFVIIPFVTLCFLGFECFCLFMSPFHALLHLLHRFWCVGCQNWMWC